ncbi:MAG: class I SAM-dependent methyltransferase [Phycisphaerales bacterium]|nr:MAG: class I SAM-dependent methyltransferase [Phycisphaerales bacterium]
MTVLQLDIERIDSVIGCLTETRRAEGDGGAVIDIDPFAVPNQAAAVLEQAAEAAGAETMVEVGMASALSTLSICRGRLRAGPMKERSFHVMDPWQHHSANIGLRAIGRAGLDPVVVFHPRESYVVLPRLLEEGARVQFAFMDGVHQLDYVTTELLYLDLMLDVGGVVALHDMWMPSLQHCVSHWLANRDYEAVALHEGRLIARPIESEKRGCGDPEKRPPFFRRNIEPFVDWSVLLIRKLGEDQRRWDYFQDYICADPQP